MVNRDFLFPQGPEATGVQKDLDKARDGRPRSDVVAQGDELGSREKMEESGPQAISQIRKAGSPGLDQIP